MATSPAARPDAIRRHNLALILDHVHRDGALTRAQLTQRLGVSRSTIGALVADLIALGLVEESVPVGGDRVGRPSHVVGPHSDGPYVIAVDVDVTHLTLAAVEIGGSVLARTSVASGPEPVTPETAADVIAEGVDELSTKSGRSAAPVALGVSVPGTVDRRTQTVDVAPNLGWRDVALGALLKDRLGPHLPIVIGNDADLSVLAELSRGNARGYSDVVYLIGRIGVGAGIVVNGAPLRGRDGRAGEIGHIVVDAGGLPCHCGKSGCLETFIGDVALLNLAGRHIEPTEEHVEAVFADAAQGEQKALEAVRTVAESVGQALGSLVNTLNPQRIILGGSLSRVLEVARDDVEHALARYAFEWGGAVELALPHFGVDSALLGAAELAFADLLADPLSGQVLLPR
jgi:predicted NBD/HSP70 family sugar kinase